MPIEVRPLSSAIGAEILGVDLSQPLDNGQWATISDAWDRYMVLFFRDQHITPQQHIDFSKRFGILEEYPFVRGIEGYPELIDIVKMPDEVKNFGHGWHGHKTKGQKATHRPPSPRPRRQGRMPARRVHTRTPRGR